MYWEWIQDGQDEDEGICEPVYDAFVVEDEVLIGHESEGQRKRRQVQHALFESLHVV